MIPDRDRNRAGISQSREGGEQRDTNGKDERAHRRRVLQLIIARKNIQDGGLRQAGFAQVGCAKSPRATTFGDP
jgi:hypothetical protein